MKFIWEAEDIKPGRYYYRNDKGHGADMGYLASVTHKIGWRADASIESEDHYVSIAITDGMVTKLKTKQEFADMLNEGEYVPLNTERLLEIITCCAKQNEGR
jgi:hypothetical protein